jgi:MFS family permease
MKNNILNKSIFNIDVNKYLKYLIIIAPCLNFLTGINIDLISPSLPALSHHFQTSISNIEEAIAISMLGFSCGCLIFGSIIDSIGRRTALIFGLLIYAAFSIMAIFSTHLNELLAIRFIQGMMVASASIGSRAMIADSFIGKQFTIAITYTSIAYGLGPVIAPFIGSILQTYFNWQANFIAFSLFSFLLWGLILFFINESIRKYKPFHIKNILYNYRKVLAHGCFLMGILIIAITVIEMLIYPTIGPFIVNNMYHKSVIIYGDTALIISLGYLFGTLANRYFIKHYTKKHLISSGFVLFSLGVMLQLFFYSLNLFNFTFIYNIF